MIVRVPEIANVRSIPRRLRQATAVAVALCALALRL
jgi:hypothetical protein